MKPISSLFSSKPARHWCNAAALICAGALTLGSAHAQSTSSTSGQNRAFDPSQSWLPYTKRGYVGINLGQGDYDLSCGNGVFGCDNTSDLAGKIYTGGWFNDFLGLELGFIDMGKGDRGGGDTRARGVNLSLVGRLPIQMANVFAKAGTTYGRTRVSTSPLSGLANGKDNGFGLSYGAGIGFDVTKTSSVVLEWERHEFNFAGLGRENVDATTIGYVHRF